MSAALMRTPYEPSLPPNRGNRTIISACSSPIIAHFQNHPRKSSSPNPPSTRKRPTTPVRQPDQAPLIPNKGVRTPITYPSIPQHAMVPSITSFLILNPPTLTLYPNKASIRKLPLQKQSTSCELSGRTVRKRGRGLGMCCPLTPCKPTAVGQNCFPSAPSCSDSHSQVGASPLFIPTAPDSGREVASQASGFTATAQWQCFLCEGRTHRR